MGATLLALRRGTCGVRSRQGGERLRASEHRGDEDDPGLLRGGSLPG